MLSVKLLNVLLIFDWEYFSDLYNKMNICITRSKDHYSSQKMKIIVNE